MKLIFSLLILFICISCSQKKAEHLEPTINDEVNEIAFFKNDTLKQIIDRILDKNNESTNLNIELLDLEGNQFVRIQVNDSVYDCTNIKGFYTYKNNTLVLIDESKKLDFTKIVDLDRSLSLDLCKKLLRKEIRIVMDPKTYIYIVNDSGKISYPNGDSLVYKNEKIKIEYWQVDDNEDKLKAKEVGEIPNTDL